MSFRITATFICDECGLQSEHEILSSGFAEQIYTRDARPMDWVTIPLVGGGDLSPRRDYCPTCKDKKR